MIKKDCKHYRPSGCMLNQDAPMIICDNCPWYDEKHLGLNKTAVHQLLADMEVTTNNATVTMDEVRSGLDAAGLSKKDYTEAIYNIQRAGGLM